MGSTSVCQDGGQYPILKLTVKGKNILYGKEEVTALKREETNKRHRAGRDGKFAPYDELLFDELRKLRKEIADEHHVPPYIIFSDKTLHEMCRYYPAALSDMRNINGVGDAKLERYGAAFIKEIKTYLDENPGISIPERAAFAQPVILPRKKTKSETMEKTYDLFKNGCSPESISKERGLAVTTISGHLEELIRDGRDIDIDRLVAPALLEKIKELFLSLGTWQLNPVIEHFGGTVSYDEAKFVRAFLQQNPCSSPAH